jgi:hypothetical protein
MTWTFATGRVGKPTTYYFDGNGNFQIVTGSRPWRDNNPGSIEYGDWARNHGAIGDDSRFAIFPDYATGRSAMFDHFFAPDSTYINLRIDEAINRRSPPSENDTEAIIRDVCNWSGLSRDKVLSQMTSEVSKIWGQS